MEKTVPVGKQQQQQQQTCPFPLQADKSPSIVLEQPLQVHWNHHTTAGLTTKAGNAKELPLLECVIALPDTLWASKDYLNHRYFHKRNLITWHILLFLEANRKIVGRVQWKYVGGNQHLPCIILTPPACANQKRTLFQVQIRLGMQSVKWIPPARLFPNRSNMAGTKLSVIYNCNLVSDQVQHTPQQELPPSLYDALILLKVWCLQRGFLGGHDSFSTIHPVAVLLEYLLHHKLVTPRMAPLQVITVFFKFVSETEWLNHDDKPQRAIVLPAEGCTEAQTISQCPQARLYAQHTKESPLDGKEDPPTLLDCFRECSDGPIFLNSSMTNNLWGRLSPSFMRHLQWACQKSLECLHSSTVTRPFQYLFMQEARFWTAMDAVMRIPLTCFEKKGRV
jgi:U3 small nucleolar RNA-associated protein 22